MKTISINVYSFNELTEEAKQNAIESVRNSYYEYNDFGRWAVDDCALFEPPQKELVELLGDSYVFPLIENTRDSIYFDTEARYSHLDCAKAMVITNREHFLLWLGIPISAQKEIEYRIATPNGRYNSTEIEFDYPEELEAVINAAEEKFKEHISTVLENIGQDIDYRFTDEAIIEDIEANELEFLEDGQLY